MKPLSSELQEKIRLMTLEGKRQDDIAAELSIHRNTVFRRQRAMGLHAWQGVTEEQEKEILKLRQIKRWGAFRISAHLAVSEYQVCQIIKKYRLRRRLGEPGYKFHPTTAQFIKIMDLALAHQHSVREIARIVGSPYKPTLRLCHEVCQCEKFITSRTLDSYLPMKWAQNKIGASKEIRDETEMTIVVVDIVRRSCFEDKMPADTAVLVAFCVEVYAAIFRRARPEVFLGPIELQKIKDCFEPRFREAVGVLRAAEVALESGLVH